MVYVLVHAKFRGNTAMRLKSYNAKTKRDGLTDGVFQYIPSWAFGEAGDNEMPRPFNDADIIKWRNLTHLITKYKW